MKTKIGIILHSSEAELDFSYLSEQTGCELHFARGVMEYAIDVARRMEYELHVEAIIASAATAHMISPHVSIPVVPLYLSNFNLVDAFVRAEKLGDSYAFIDITEDHIYNLDYISTMMGYDIKRYEFHSVSATEEVVQKILQDGREVVVTAANCMYSCARRHSLHAVLIRIGRQDIISAIHTAKRILAAKMQETEKSRWLSTIVENTGDGLITIDSQNRVTLINSMAQEILGIPPASLIGHALDEFSQHNPLASAIASHTSNLYVVRGDTKEYVISHKAVASENAYFGSVIHIRILKELQETELFARKKILEHGFVSQNTFADIIGDSACFSAVKEKALRYAAADSTVLILGESGCGKELFAQGTHNASLRRNGPFVAINCATLSENLLDSELFGYEDGAFTGAKRGGKAGLFELSHGGTLFLDELGGLPLQLQAKLLRTLQEKSVRRIGGSKNIPIDVRVICATNRNLFEEVKKGSFREDLYYRINILTLIIPPLRDRKEDIPLLINHYLAPRTNLKFSSEQLSMLQQYDWPGNVRELYNFLDRFFAMQFTGADLDSVFSNLFDELIHKSLHASISEHVNHTSADPNHLLVPIGSMHVIEQTVIRALLEKYHGDKREVEKTLDISSTTLWRRLKEAQ